MRMPTVIRMLPGFAVVGLFLACPLPEVGIGQPCGHLLAEDTPQQKAIQLPHKLESSTATVGFEQAKPGPFKKLESAIGTWTSSGGISIVDDKHAKTGRQCLQLTGGESNVVTLALTDDAETTGELKFWAERWTKRRPFKFRIEKDSGDGWKEIYNGDDQVRVGRAFLSQIKVPLDDGRIQKLRFICQSPPGTGILIDDVRLAPARPQEIVGVNFVPLTLPALVGADASSLLRLNIKATGNLEPISLTELRGRIDGIENIRALMISANEFEMQSRLELPSTSSTMSWKPTPMELVDGDNSIWIGCQLKPDANIDDRVGAAIESVTFSDGTHIKLETASATQRIGVAVRKAGDDGNHTYRIPGLVTTKKGTLIGVYDVRHRSGRDLPGDIDVGMSRSTDGGRNWEAMKIIMDMGDDPDWRYDGIGDPAILVDRNTGTIWVAATWSHGNRSWFGSGPGIAPEETGQLMLVRSNDDGLTWSKPINITKQVKKPEWSFLLQGPGKGITMRDGTIVFAAQYQDPPNATDKTTHRLPHSTMIFSRDHGETWQVGTGSFDDTTEAQVVETEPGTLMLNCRYNRSPYRVVMTTRDLGQTWKKHATSERSLIEPGACMASLINVRQELGKGSDNWLLFSNPNSRRGRNHITIKASPNHGRTWPKEHHLLLDEGNGAGYSCMTMIDEATVGILYEGSQAQMTFQRIPLNDVIGHHATPTATSKLRIAPSGSAKPKTTESLPQ